jgi:hypothetical protein
MPVFLDTHRRADHEIGSFYYSVHSGANRITLVRIIDVPEENRVYCLIDAPDLKTISQFHIASGVNCDWIEEVTSLDEAWVWE